MLCRPGVACVLLAVMSFGTGCSRPIEAKFVIAGETAVLPEEHRVQIEDGLQRMFGLPLHPRLLTSLPAGVVSSGVQMKTEESTESESPAVDEGPGFTFLDTSRLRHGARVYSRRCVGCHGASGDGNGPAAAYLRPKPRDYRKGIFKFTSTAFGERPTRQDLMRTIRRGAKGTSMPAFPWMAKDDAEAVIDYVIYLSLRGKVESEVAYMAEDYDEDEPLESDEFADAMESEIENWERAQFAAIHPISARPPYDLESVELGRRLFIKSSCYSCHGEDAKGQTEWLSPEFLASQELAATKDKIQINFDEWGEPAPAANITAGMLHGGRRPLDIYRRIYTGINGTPMPQFGLVFSSDPQAIWHMVHYVMHVVDGGDPAVGVSVSDVMQE